MERLAIVAGLLTGLVPLPVRGEEPSPPAIAGLEAPAGIEERIELAPIPSQAPRHEALLSTTSGADDGKGGAERVPKSPPTAVAERPGAGPNRPGAQWVGGYWAWDPPRRDFVWVTGTWQVPPTGKFWVNGYWRRDGRGWYRVPGFWSAREDQEEEPRSDWKKDGPPHPPEEDAGPPPGPNSFYVAGVYAPDSKKKELVWRSGFWYQAQPGWEWIPARWVRRSSGWIFREGSWQRAQVASDDPDAETTPNSSAVPPGYPATGSSYVPPNGYGPGRGSLRGRFGGFINQILP